MTRLLVVSPVHNEGAHIARVARAVAAQTRPPDRWIVVDDASTDDTLTQLRALEDEIPFLTVVARPPTRAAGDRLSAALEVKAFHAGLAEVGDLDPYGVIGKLDGDIELPPDYFARLVDAFDDDPRRGVAGSRLVEPHGDRLIPVPNNDHHVHGAVKFFSADCYRAVGGLEERLGWDTIDETRARMLGFTTGSLPGLIATHLRPYGSAQGVMRGRARHGECAYVLQVSVWWMLLKAARSALGRPYLLGGLAYVWGYTRAGLRRTPRVEYPGYRRFVRSELRHRIIADRP